MPIIVSGSTTAPSAATTVLSPDGKLSATTDSVFAGIKLVANFSSLSMKPVRVRFERLDGTRVRSGDPAEAPGGIGYAYEHEAKLGVGWPVRAVPIFQLGSSAVSGIQDGTGRTGKQRENAWSYADYDQATGYASLLIPDTSGLRDVWVKSVGNPSLSMLLSGKLPLLVETEEARFEPVTVPGYGFPVGPYDVRTQAPMDVTFALETLVERQTFKSLRAAGPVLVQCRTGYLDGGDFYALPMTTTTVPPVAQWKPRRDVTVTFQPIDRPPTQDAPLRVPGYSIDEALVLAPTISQAAITWPTVANASGF